MAHTKSISIDELHRQRRPWMLKCERRQLEKDIVENPAKAIAYFLQHFRFYRSGGVTVGATPPPDFVLEFLARCFRNYMRGKGSLDQAFGLVSRGKGRGSANPKERLRRQEETWFAAFVYYEYLDEESGERRNRKGASERAITKTANELNCSVSKIKKLLTAHHKQYSPSK